MAAPPKKPTTTKPARMATGYTGNPFGPFLGEETGARNRQQFERATREGLVEHGGGAAVDVIDAIDWVSVLHLETGAFRWGQLVISCEAQACSGTTKGGIDPLAPDWLRWAEIRVLVTVSGLAQIWFEGAAGNHAEPGIGGGEKSSGPIILPFALGEVPDSLDVFARSRCGGAASRGPFDQGGGAVEFLNVTAATRFQR
jgi:hypothetical protein